MYYEIVVYDSRYSNDVGYEVYTISEETLRMKKAMCNRLEGVRIENLTSRLIVLLCDDETSDKCFFESLAVCAQKLKSEYKHFRVWNVSQKRNDVKAIFDAIPFGWPGGTTPQLEKLCTICKQIDQYLVDHPLNVAVIFCKGRLERAAIVVDALMRYNAISAIDDLLEDRFSMQKFSEKYLTSSECLPSYKRYIGYFTSLLSGRIAVNTQAMYLKKIGISHFGDQQVYVKIYERLSPVYQTIPAILKETSYFDIEHCVKLRGDVFIKCIIAASSPASRSRCLFTCQINTCSIDLNFLPETDRNCHSLKLHKEDLDLVFNDKKVSNSAALELFLTYDVPPVSFASAAAQTIVTLLPRNNSYERFDCAQDEHENRSNVEVEYSEIRKNRNSGRKIADAEKMPAPPPVPPKPSTPIMNGERIDFEIPERRGILPAQIREKINKKKEFEGRATPSIEPDLVGQDRYDRASRCFSYVPAKSVQEAFERPRRSSITKTIERREESVDRVSQDEVASVAIPRSYTPSHMEPPKWDEQVEEAKQAALLEELARAPSTIHDIHNEKPQVIEQAQKAVVTPTSTLQRRNNFGSYRTLNDDAYCSDMDDLCNPDYYLNFTTKPAAQTQPHAGSRSVQMPRKKLNPSTFGDLDDVLNTTNKLSPAYSVGDVRSTTNVYGRDNEDGDRQNYRQRNCQSVNNQRQPESDNVADSWLNGKLKKVRSRRDIDSDLARRRTQEQILLNELKEPTSHTTTQFIDPLAEFRKEEERLKNTRSPYDGWRGRMRGKPPTPPPRESSTSPVNRMTPNYELNRQRHNQSVPLPATHRHNDDEVDVNSLLNYTPSYETSTIERGRSLSRGARIQDAYYASHQDLPARFNSGQERVAAAICRAETPHRDIYASGTLNRAETPGRYFPENSAVLERAATPSFPVSRSTPLPFHPLLYNNNNNGSNGYSTGTLNHRSSSPRNAQHYNSSTLSRHSSINSVGE
ncbi:unnamed protein product [Caenorhabditis bovis]|uniref:C2 tensin-type domain-containing protein n=1 Tax=Caenorhabditis bovis TaxID=2654633 RepID=A0A8S1F689_9PELO|nr:unnamed protein product [Caenorhabditis bovis]